MFGILSSWLANTRLSYKLGFGPVLMALFMLGMGAVSQHGARQQSAALDQVVKVTFAKDRATVQARKALAAAHIDLYRMISWQTNSTDAGKQAQERAQRIKVTWPPPAARSILSVRRYSLAPQEATALQAARAAAKDYVSAVNDVLDMAAVDTATALTFMLQADGKYTTLGDRLADLDALEQRLTDGTVAAATAGASSATMLCLAMLAAALALAGLVAVLGSRGIARPILGMARAMARLASGDVSAAIPAWGAVKDRPDGRRGAGVQGQHDPHRPACRRAGDPEHEQKERRQQIIEGHIKTLDQAVAGSLDMLASASSELQTTARSMSATAEQTTQQATSVASAVERSSSNVQTAAAAAEQLLGFHLGDFAPGCRVGPHRGPGCRGCRPHQRTGPGAGRRRPEDRRCDRTDQPDRRPDQSIGTERNHRSGEGRGSRQGLRGGRIGGQESGDADRPCDRGDRGPNQVDPGRDRDSARAIGSIAGTINRINEIATTIAAAVEQQGAATKEIARSVQQASDGATEVSHSIATVARAASSAGSASAQVLGAAGNLAAQGETLRGDVGRFLASIRAA